MCSLIFMGVSKEIKAQMCDFLFSPIQADGDGVMSV